METDYVRLQRQKQHRQLMRKQHAKHHDVMLRNNWIRPSPVAIHCDAQVAPEVVSSRPIHVGKACELPCKRVATFAAGTKLRVLEQRITPNGTQRLCVALPGSDKAIGWVTARKERLGDATVRDSDAPAHGDGRLVLAMPLASKTSARGSNLYCVALVQEKWSARSGAEPHIPREPHLFYTSSAVDPQLSRGMLAASKGSLTDRQLPTSRSMQSQSSTAGRSMAQHVGGRARSPPLSVADAEAAASGVTEGSSLTRSRPLTLATTPAAATPAAATPATDAATGEAPRDDSRQNIRQRWQRAVSAAKEPALLPSTELITAIKELQAQHDAAASSLESAGARSLGAQVGQALKAKLATCANKATFLQDLMREWDPNRDGAISKMEFRTNVRNLLGPGSASLEAGAIDALFASLDTNKSGEMDVGEVRVALKKLLDEANRAAQSDARVQLHVDKFAQRVARAQEACTVTVRAEELMAAMHVDLGMALGASLGMALRKKDMANAREVVHSWANEEGMVNRKDFGGALRRIGVVAGIKETNSLFDYLAGADVQMCRPRRVFC